MRVSQVEMVEHRSNTASVARVDFLLAPRLCTLYCINLVLSTKGQLPAISKVA